MITQSKRKIQQQNNKRQRNRKEGMIRCRLIFFVPIFVAVAVVMIHLHLSVVQGIGEHQELLLSDTTVIKPKEIGTKYDKEQPGKDNKDGTKYHVIFSTSCNMKNDWQSYLFFYLAMKKKQPGEVTQIVSGCNQDEEKDLRKRHEELISGPMRKDFHIHFTPDYSTAGEFQTTKYWNKPFGVKHWMEHRFGYNYDNDKDDVAESTIFDDDIIVLVDPDMLIQTPFVNDFSRKPITHWTSYYQKNPENIFHKVSRGHVIAQLYGFGHKWRTGADTKDTNFTYVVGTNDSPIWKLSKKEAAGIYAGGPPYLATVRDFYRIVHYWTEFTPRWHHENPVFMSEMYGYSMAVAHLGLKHQLAKGMMISNVDVFKEEGWDFLPSTFEHNSDDMLEHACDMSRYPTQFMPETLHFCQRYSIGNFFISKYKLPGNTFSCGFPLYEEPPTDVAKNTFSLFGNFQSTEWNVGNEKHTFKRAANAFMVCSLYSSLNEAATFYKDHHCGNESHVNYKKEWNYFKVYGKDPHGPGGDGKSKKSKR